jgi:hypothetical protein
MCSFTPHAPVRVPFAYINESVAPVLHALLVALLVVSSAPTGAVATQLPSTSTWRWTCVEGYFGNPVNSFCHPGTGTLVMSASSSPINCTSCGFGNYCAANVQSPSRCPGGTYGAWSTLTTPACSGNCRYASLPYVKPRKAPWSPFSAAAPHPHPSMRISITPHVFTLFRRQT